MCGVTVSNQVAPVDIGQGSRPRHGRKRCISGRGGLEAVGPMDTADFGGGTEKIGNQFEKMRR